METMEICKLFPNPGVTVGVKAMFSESGLKFIAVLKLVNGETFCSQECLDLEIPEGITFTDEELKQGMKGILPENSPKVNNFLAIQERRIGEMHFLFVCRSAEDGFADNEKFGVNWGIYSRSTFEFRIFWFEDWQDEAAISTLKTIFVEHKIFNLLDGNAVDEMIVLLGRYQEFKSRAIAQLV